MINIHIWRSVVIILGNGFIRVCADERELPLSPNDTAAGKLWTQMDLSKPGVSAEIAGGEMLFKSERHGESCNFRLDPKERRITLDQFHEFLQQQLRGDPLQASITRLAIGSAWFASFTGAASVAGESQAEMSLTEMP